MKYGKHILSFALLFLFFLKTEAQLLDSFKVILKSRRSLDLRIESRYSFIDNDFAGIRGVRAGVSFGRKLRFGAGVSWLKNDIAEYDIIRNEKNVLIITPKYLKLAYVCLYADFVFYKTKRWQLSVPVQTGVGASWFQNKNSYDLNSPNKHFLLLYEPGISTHFKIFKWCGIGVDVGYRFVLKNNKYVGDRFNSPTYAFKFMFWADQLFFDLFPKSKVSEKFGPSAW